MTDRKPRVALCCDVGPAAGAQHMLRGLALAEELSLRGAAVVFVCDVVPSPTAAAQIAAHGWDAVDRVRTAAEHVALFDRLEVDAAVFDAPRLDAGVCASVRRTGRPTVAVGDLHGVAADVLVDPTIGAEENPHDVPASTTVLAGLDYALMRNDVLANRPISPRRHDNVEVPRVVAVLDGDDAAATAPVLARLLTETGRPFQATFVMSGTASGRDAAASTPAAAHQRIDVVEPTWRVHDRVARADAVLSAAGPSTYEWLCMGAAVGLVWAVEDHVEDYRRLMVRRAVIGLGSAASLREDAGPAVHKATRLLSDARERARLAEVGWRMVDGLGRARVADALLALL